MVGYEYEEFEKQTMYKIFKEIEQVFTQQGQQVTGMELISIPNTDRKVPMGHICASKIFAEKERFKRRPNFPITFINWSVDHPNYKAENKIDIDIPLLEREAKPSTRKRQRLENEFLTPVIVTKKRKEHHETSLKLYRPGSIKQVYANTYNWKAKSNAMDKSSYDYKMRIQDLSVNDTRTAKYLIKYSNHIYLDSILPHGQTVAQFASYYVFEDRQRRCLQQSKLKLRKNLDDVGVEATLSSCENSTIPIH